MEVCHTIYYINVHNMSLMLCSVFWSNNTTWFNLLSTYCKTQTTFWHDAIHELQVIADFGLNTYFFNSFYGYDIVYENIRHLNHIYYNILDSVPDALAILFYLSI